MVYKLYTVHGLEIEISIRPVFLNLLLDLHVRGRRRQIADLEANEQLFYLAADTARLMI